VTVGKPDPQVFLTAARKLGFPPERCVVFEDAHVGSKRRGAVDARGGVATTHAPEELTKADRVVRG